jgi:hypothetical protein
MLPFEPVIRWDKLLLRLEEAFDWSDVPALEVQLSFRVSLIHDVFYGTNVFMFNPRLATLF